jgi:hypothetical protein
MSDDVLARLQALEDEAAIVRRLHRYGHAIDGGDEAAWIDCFTADGVFEGYGRREGGDPLYRLEGRAALAEFVNGHTRRPFAYHVHGLLEPVVELDGDRARCVSYFVVLQHHESEPRVRVLGRYHDELVRDSDGEWRFARRTARIDSALRGLPDLGGGQPADQRQPVAT